MLKTPYHNIRPLYITRMLKNVCPLPLKANTYYGCDYGCVYCNGHVLTKTRSERTVEPIPLGYLKRTFKRALSGKGKGEIHQVIRKRWPVQLGVLADPFPLVEMEYQNTLEFLRFMDMVEYPCMILTKSDMICRDEYLELLNDKSLVMVSIPSYDNSFWRNCEPGVPSPKRRLQVLKTLLEHDIKVTLRIWPLIPTVNEDTEKLINEAADIGVTEILGSYLHLYNDKVYLEKLNNRIGYNILKECEKQDIKFTRTTKYRMADDNHRLKVLQDMKDQCSEHGIKFYTPNSPVMNDWQCCCGSQLDGCNGDALKMKGYQLRWGVSVGEYLPGDYPFLKPFEKEFNNGDFCKRFNDIEFDNERMIYKTKGG